MKSPRRLRDALMIAVLLLLAALILRGAYLGISERQAAAEARIRAEWQELQHRALAHPYREQR